MYRVIFDYKLRASSIVETLVASVIIVIIFSLASLTLNNIFQSNILSDTGDIENRVNKLIYLNRNRKIATPYYEDYKGWEVFLTLSHGEIIVKADKHIGENDIKSFKKSVFDDNN